MIKNSPMCIYDADFSWDHNVVRAASKMDVLQINSYNGWSREEPFAIQNLCMC